VATARRTDTPTHLRARPVSLIAPKAKLGLPRKETATGAVIAKCSFLVAAAGDFIIVLDSRFYPETIEHFKKPGGTTGKEEAE
jgi:hypothetical protein